jgi:quinol---cytochrome c reductase iron-sulfur subunit, bacillus type
MPKSPHMSRREFVSIVTAAVGTVMGATIGLPAIGYLIAPSLNKVVADVWIPAGSVDNYPVGVPTLFNFNRTKINGWEKTVNSYGVYIVKQDDGSILALSNKCTHLSCRVNWKQDNTAYICPCHDAWFDIHGGIIKGPQPRPLDKFETKVEENTLYIHFQGS